MKKINFLIIMLIVSVSSLLYSCDNPKSIAWSYYYCAKDTLEAGDPYMAKEYLVGADLKSDSVLTFKRDSLMKVIDKAIASKNAKDSLSKH